MLNSQLKTCTYASTPCTFIYIRKVTPYYAAECFHFKNY